MSEHFLLSEFLHSDTALALSIENTPSWEDVERLVRLAETMEFVRAILGAPIVITSGFRCPMLNVAVGGATNSAHLSGLACDFVAPLFGAPEQVCRAIEPHVGALAIDQLIWEYGEWTHLGLSADPADARGQCLTIDNGGTASGFA